MIPDPTDEIRAIKRKLAAECGNDIRRIAEESRRRQRESRRPSVSVPQPQLTAEDMTNNAFNRSGG
jgi:hypothetical protein